jgi:glutamate racemase
MLVALAEEGWTNGPISEQIVTRYLDIPRNAGFEPETVILGCTHFPLLYDVVRSCLDPSIVIVDSAQTTANELAKSLQSSELLAKSGHGGLTLLATDGATRFARVGGRFLGKELNPDDIEIVDL